MSDWHEEEASVDPEKEPFLPGNRTSTEMEGRDRGRPSPFIAQPVADRESGDSEDGVHLLSKKDDPHQPKDDHNWRDRTCITSSFVDDA